MAKQRSILGKKGFILPVIPAYTTIYYIGGTSARFYDATLTWSGIGKASYKSDTNPNMLSIYGGKNCVSLGQSLFRGCTSLTVASFPYCTSIGSSAFNGCSALTRISFPECVMLPSYAFYNCENLSYAFFPKVSRINGASVFAHCETMTAASFPMLASISGSNTFKYCYNLISLYLMGSSVCSLRYSSIFSSCPIGGYSTSAKQYGSIYVPTSLLTTYKNTSNWKYFSSRFVGI